MREIVRISPGNSPTLPSDTEADVEIGESEDVIGCLPRLFAVGHREEVDSIIHLIPSLVVQGRERDLEGRFERYQKLLDLYQEQPSLLDCAIPSLLRLLLSFVRLPPSSQKNKLDRQSTVALQFAYHLSKVRGHKVMMRLLPHEVSFLPGLLSCLESYSNPVTEDLPERMMLLLWLTIVCRNPFDLSRFDGSAEKGSTMKRVFNIGMSYLRPPLNKTTFASWLLAECVSRPDGRSLISPTLSSLVNQICSALSFVSKNGKLTRSCVEELFGSLSLILAIMKKVDRSELSGESGRLVECARLLLSSSTDDTLLKKLTVKLAQRVALIELRPKLASWRYSHGKRRIEENLRVIKDTPAASTDMATASEEKVNGASVAIEEDEEAPSQVVEWAVGVLLTSLVDGDTTVRWSAAKGIGRIAGRLSRDFASQIVESILGSNFHPHAGNASWHGGCLALAELSRRGCLLPAQLPGAFRVIESALFFQEPTGRFALGANVRDSACFVCWAWARAYEAAELAPFLENVAVSLMCVSLFDREVSIRRAASAAFQENVGRQGSFPNGIKLLTIADYFAVGSRRRCFGPLAVSVASFARYTSPLVTHLVTEKVCHWDEVIREEAASCLSLLVPVASLLLLSNLADLLIPGIHTKNPIHRHGFLVSSARVASSLFSSSGWPEQHTNDYDKIVLPLASVPESLLPECAICTNSLGVETTKRAAAIAMKELAAARLPLSDQQINSWLSLLQVLTSDAKEAIVQLAEQAAQQFFPVYVNESEERKLTIASALRVKIVEATKEAERRGACLLASCLPPHTLRSLLLPALSRTIEHPAAPDKLWAFSRSAAVRAVTVAAAAFAPGTADEACRILCLATDDYTTDQRGDIGRFVREAAMAGLASLAASSLISTDFIPIVVSRIVLQSAEKISKTRVCACECMQVLLSSPLSSSLPSLKLLSSVYSSPRDFISDSILVALLSLAECSVLRSPLLRALIISAGGISEGTTRLASEALLQFVDSSPNQTERVAEVIGQASEMLCESSLRVSLSTLRCLPRLLSRVAPLIEKPDHSGALSSILAHLIKLLQKSKNPSRCRLALETMTALLCLPQESKVWRACAESCISALSAPFPAVRQAAAEGLAEGLAVAAIFDEEAIAALSETAWHQTGDMSVIEKSSALVRQRLLSPSPMLVD